MSSKSSRRKKLSSKSNVLDGEEGVTILGAEVGILMVGVEEARATMARLMEMLRQLLLLVVTIMVPDRKHHVDFVENNIGTA